MPSKSKAQRNFMAAAAHNPAFAKKVGVPVDVAQEFNKADKGKKFGGGGMAKTCATKSDAKMIAKKEVKGHESSMHKMKNGGEIKKMAFGGRALPLRGGAPMRSSPSATLSRGMAYANKKPGTPFKKGGIVEKGTGEKYKSKAAMMKHEKKETKAEEMKEHKMKKGGMCGYASGGKVSQLSKANGIATKGKTRGKIC